MSEAIWISGAGLITPLGGDRQSTWEAICAGRCGIGPLTAMEQDQLPGKEGGQVPPLHGDDKRENRVIRYLRQAIEDALHEAGAAAELPYDPARCGIILGTTLHGMPAAARFFRSDDPADLQSFLAGAVLEGAAGDTGLTGFSATTCSACSSGLGSVALAMTLLRNGELDMVVAGGYDPISEYAYAGFNSLRLVAESPLRPFCEGREGMKVSEGYGIVVLERAGDAQRRSVQPLAEVRAFGESADVHHLTQPNPEGEGASRAIVAALEAADLTVADIGLISAHATGTPDNDSSEAAALRDAFGGRLRDVPLVAFKSHLGHTLGGAGAVELILSAMAMRDGKVPPTANVTPEAIAYDDLAIHTGTTAKDASIAATLNLSLGFGGANTAVILTPPRRDEESPNVITVDRTVGVNTRSVGVTGVGVVMGGAVGNDAFIERLGCETALDLNTVSSVDRDALAGLIHARRARRMSGYVQLSLAATAVALEHAGVDDVAAFGAEAGAILGTVHGSTLYSTEYYQQIVAEGVGAANPLLFAEGVPNAGAAHLSMTFGVKGACQTIIGSRTAGLDAIRLATARIATGAWDRAIISTAEEDTPLIERVYRHCNVGAERDRAPAAAPFGQGGGVSGSGAVTLILESAEAAAKRGAQLHARIDATASAWATAGNAPRMVEKLDGVWQRLGDDEALVTTASGDDQARIEQTALKRAAHRKPRRVGGIYGHAPEMFSVMGMAAIAAIVLRQRLPRLCGEVDGNGLTAAEGIADEKGASVLALDRSGAVAGVRLGWST